MPDIKGQSVGRSSIISRIADRFFAPVDVLPLVWFRIVFGGTLLYWSVNYYANGFVDQYYVLPRFHFSWPFFGWVHALSEAGMYRLFLVIAVSAAFVMVGFAYRISSTVLGLCFAWVFLIDKAFYQNHYYLLSLVGLMMPLIPCHRSVSVDSLLFRAKRTAQVPVFYLLLVRFCVGLPYFFGGIAKLTPDWLAGQPPRMMLAGRTWMPIIGQWFTENWMVYGFVWGGLLLDLLIVPAILWRRTRWAALIFGLGFHVSNALMFHIGVFPWFMIFATLVLLPAEYFRNVWRNRPASVTYTCPGALTKKVVTVLVLLFMVVHCLVPFRHWFYGGQVEWNEHGHHFSWRMKLRGKETAMRLAAYDPVSGASDLVNPKRWLTPFQVNRMARDPKMVHQFARFVKTQYAEQGYPNTEIHATVMCSLNGRKPQLLIDPEVDLASIPVPLAEPAYVVELSEPLRDKHWSVPRNQWEQFVPKRYRLRSK